MPTSRLFGFRPTKKPAAETPKQRAIEKLADRIYATSRSVPNSAAWGLSPAETYLRKRLHLQRQP